MALEYKMLASFTLFFLFAFLPSSIGKWQSFGAKWLASNREPIPGKSLNEFGARAERAYHNLKDYFPAFVVAILLLGSLNKFTPATEVASVCYVLGRLVHFFAYCAGNFPLRFLGYVIAVGANVFLLIQIF
jgi:uncharacterized MAPEG superfamily protein